jgi:protein phosphatase
LWSGHRLGLVHVGDSRCYLLRDGALTQITHDHTLVQQFVDEGRISAEEASYHPQRALITRALDGAPELELDLSVRESRAGDRYLLCTDGLSGVVSEETMLDALRDPEPAKACEQLVDLALRGGGPDNVTCIVADVVDSAAPDAEALVPVVAGAATFDPTTPAPRSDTPAGRAALATWARRAARLHRAPSSAPTPTRPRLRPVIVTLVVVAVLAGLAVGADAYLRSQWFVGATDGPSRSVAIFRGLNASVAGLRLASVARRTGLPLQALDGYDRQQVEAGIPVSGLASGQAKVTQLRIDACTGLTSRLPQVRHPHPAPSARPRSRPRTTSSPAPVPSQLASLLAAAGCGGASQ